jgi:hypothetical protein
VQQSGTFSQALVHPGSSLLRTSAFLNIASGREKRNREKEKNAEIISDKIFCEGFVVDLQRPQKEETRPFSVFVALRLLHTPLRPPRTARVLLLDVCVCKHRSGDIIFRRKEKSIVNGGSATK